MAHGISDSRSPQVEYLDERNEAWCGGCVSIAADPGLVDRGSLRKKAPQIRPYRAISVHRRCRKRFARRAGELRRGWYPTVSLGHASNAFATRWRRSGSAHWSRWRYSSAVCSADLPQRAHTTLADRLISLSMLLALLAFPAIWLIAAKRSDFAGGWNGFFAGVPGILPRL